MLERYGYDPVLAGAARLGREAGVILGTTNRGAVNELLFDDELLEALATDMGGRIVDNLSPLRAYRDGFA